MFVPSVYMVEVTTSYALRITPSTAGAAAVP
jgi:hypothetical protein